MDIFIFHRDLRIIDNTSLIAQIKEFESTIPIFIFPPDQIDENKNKYFCNNSVQFMIESLKELSSDIRKKGGKLYFFKGDTMDVLNSLNKKFDINSIAYNLDYTPYARKRDDNIKKWCEQNEITLIEKEDYPLYDIMSGQTMKQNGTPYLVFTPFKNHCFNDLEVKQVNKFNKFSFDKYKELEKNKYHIDESEIEDFFKDNPLINVNGGRKNGLTILKNISKFKDYSKNRDELTYKTTFLGPYLKFGCVSIRETYYKMLDKLGKNSGLLNELCWRDFYLNITWYFPRVLHGQITGQNKSFREEYDNIKWSKDTKLFNAWCQGETGFPIVDAAMRQMNTIGYMHNRARMIVASFLGKDLHLDWRLGEKYFAQKLIDYDPSSNSGGWMWANSNGTDAQPWFRIFNPWTQAEKFDSECEYIKKWIPELNDMPNKDILNWFKPEVHDKYLKLGIKYFKPIVDHDIQRKKTLEIFKKGLK